MGSREFWFTKKYAPCRSMGACKSLNSGWLWRTSSRTSPTTNAKSLLESPTALAPSVFKPWSQDPMMPLGFLSRGQLARSAYTRPGISTCMGHTRTQRKHMVHIQTHGVDNSSSSRPRAAMRNSLRGSMPARPEAGQPLLHAPQVMHMLKSNRKRYGRSVSLSGAGMTAFIAVASVRCGVSVRARPFRWGRARTGASQPHVGQVFAQVAALVLAKAAHGKADQRPQVDHGEVPSRMLGQIMNLRWQLWQGAMQ